MRSVGANQRHAALAMINDCNKQLNEVGLEDTMEDCVLKLHYIPNLSGVEEVASLMATIRKHISIDPTNAGTLDSFELDQVVLNVTKIPELLERFSDSLILFLNSLVDIPWYKSLKLCDPGFYMFILEELMPKVTERYKKLAITLISRMVRRWGNCNDFFNTVAGPFAELLSQAGNEFLVDPILFAFAQVMTIVDTASIENAWPVFDILTRMIASQVQSPALFQLLNGIITTDVPYQFLTKHVCIAYHAIYQMLENPDLSDDCRWEILRMIELSVVCLNWPAIDALEWRFILMNLECFSEKSVIQMCRCIMVGVKGNIKMDEMMSLNPLPNIFQLGCSSSHEIQCVVFEAISQIIHRGYAGNVIETLQELDYIQSLVDFIETAGPDDTGRRILEIGLESLIYLSDLIREAGMDDSFIQDNNIQETIDRVVDEIGDPKLAGMAEAWKAFMNPRF